MTELPQLSAVGSRAIALGQLSGMEVGHMWRQARLSCQQRDLWIDSKTRVVFVELTVLSPNENHFAFVTLVTSRLVGKA